MIICSCNVISDHQVRAAMATAPPPRSLRELFRRLGDGTQCGRCASSFKLIMKNSADAPTVKRRQVGLIEDDLPPS
jgi:bacterioferritin-associated ferredoxin